MMDQSCPNCNVSFSIDEAEITALEKLSPVINSARYTLPPPRLCPTCRLQRRFSFRNDQHYYRNNCALCGSGIISIYSPDKPFPVYCESCFWSDRWDPLDYGTDYDSSRSFFEQFAEMRLRVPRIATFNTQSENSLYTVHASRNKNCYICCSTISCEDVLYADMTVQCRDSIDLFSCFGSELLYECIHSTGCSTSEYLELCNHLSDSFMCYDCRSSRALVGCVGLRSSGPAILNEQVSESECQQLIAELKSDRQARAEFAKRFEELKLATPRRAAWTESVEDCTGDILNSCRRVTDSFNVRDAEDTRYANEVVKANDCYGICRCGTAEMLYECHGNIELRYSCFCNLCYQSHNLLYCDNCQAGCADCFGCMSLRRERNCVLNKRYRVGDYHKLVHRIISEMQDREEWGEFFPIGLSSFGYNESKAQEWFPLSRESCLDLDWNWSDYDAPMAGVKRVVKPEELPEDIADISDEVLDYALICGRSGRPFRLTAQELTFYRRRGIAIPLLAPTERHRERIRDYRARCIKHCSCDGCGTSTLCSLLPRPGERVLCDPCYFKERY